MLDTVNRRKEYMTYAIGSVVFITLAGLTLYLVFKNFKGDGSFTVPGIFTWKTAGELLILLFLFYIFDGLRLLFVFKAIDTHVPFLLMMKLVFINVFASGVTPLATGGGFAQIYFLGKNGIPLGTATAATTIRTVIASMIIFALVPVILTAEKGLGRVIVIHHGVIYSLMLIMLYVLLFYGLVKQKAVLKKIIFLFLNLLLKVHVVKDEKYSEMKKSAETEIARFSENLMSFWKGRKAYMVLSFFSSCAYLFLLFFFPYVLIRAMSVKVHLLTVLYIQVLITFLIYFTPTPGGSGIAEGGFAVIFSRFVYSSYVPQLTFYWRFLTMYLGMLIGFAIFYREVWRKDRDRRN